VINQQLKVKPASNVNKIPKTRNCSFWVIAWLFTITHPYVQLSWLYLTAQNFSAVEK